MESRITLAFAALIVTAVLTSAPRPVHAAACDIFLTLDLKKTAECGTAEPPKPPPPPPPTTKAASRSGLVIEVIARMLGL